MSKLNSRGEKSEKKVSEWKDSTTEITHIKRWRENELKERQSLRGLWNSNKRPPIHVTEVLEGEEKKGEAKHSYFLKM